MAIGVTAIASLGQSLHVAGHRIVALPWRLLRDVPVLDNVLPARLAVARRSPGAVGVALWAARSGAALWLRVSLPTLAVLALVPNLGLSTWSRAPSRSSSAALLGACIGEGNVLLVPWGYDDALFWRRRAVPVPHRRRTRPSRSSTFCRTIVSRLFNDHAHPGDGPDLVAFARSRA